MCTVSMIGDFYKDRIPEKYPWMIQTGSTSYSLNPSISRDEFEALRKDVQEIKELLIRAKLYDEANGEPDCEMEEKVEFLKRVAEWVGIDLNDVFDG